MNSSRAKEQVKERIEAIQVSLNAPSAPSEEVVDGLHQNGHLANGEEPEAQGATWEDVKELLVLEHSRLHCIHDRECSFNDNFKK